MYIIEQGISLEFFNELLNDIRNPADYVAASLSGNFGGSRGEASIRLGASQGDFQVHQDVDSIGVYSQNIPVAHSFGRLIINTTIGEVRGVSEKTHVGVRLEGDEDFQDINGIPNYIFGRFGDLGRFRVSNILLLHLQMFAQCRNFIHTHLLLIILYRLQFVFPSTHCKTTQIPTAPATGSTLLEVDISAILLTMLFFRLSMNCMASSIVPQEMLPRPFRRPRSFWRIGPETAICLPPSMSLMASSCPRCRTSFAVE